MGRRERWDWTPANCSWNLARHRNAVCRTCCLSHGRSLVVLSDVGHLSLWELGSGRRASAGRRSAQSAVFTHGPLLAATDWENGVHVCDTHTAKKLTTFFGHRGAALCLVFTPDGQRLISGGTDGTAVVWDLQPLLKKQHPLVNLTAKQIEKLWSDLGNNNGQMAYQAIHTLSLDPQGALPWFDKHLRPAPVVNVLHMQHLIQQLDSKKFAARAQAETALLGLGRTAGSACGWRWRPNRRWKCAVAWNAAGSGRENGNLPVWKCGRSQQSRRWSVWGHLLPGSCSIAWRGGAGCPIDVGAWRPGVGWTGTEIRGGASGMTTDHPVPVYVCARAARNVNGDRGGSVHLNRFWEKTHNQFPNSVKT